MNDEKTLGGLPPSSPSDDRDFIQSIERGFAVLTAFNAEAPQPTLAQIVRKTGFSRPAVRRILLTLQRLGYVSTVDSRWVLTPRVLSIGQHYTATHSLTEISQPYLLTLAQRTSESASLGTLDGTEVVYTARVPVRRIMSINVSVGTRVPAYATSMGRVLLAWRGPDEINDYFAQVELEALAPQTTTSPDALRSILEQVRKDGYSIVDQELELGLLSASAPVRNARGEIVAALASSTSNGRSTVQHISKEIIPILLDTATAISAELGYHPR